MAPPQPATPVFSVSGPELLLIECPYNRAFDDAIHDDRTTVIQPDQMCRTPPNQVADHGIIPIAHPRVRSGYGRGHASNKFVRIGLGQRFPIWFPMQTVEFYARQVKCGSNARGHGRLAGTRGPNHHDAHLIFSFIGASGNVQSCVALARGQPRPAGSNPSDIQASRCAGAVSMAMNLPAASRRVLAAMIPAA